MCDLKVSVIIPVYNTKEYLAECLDSVVGQEFDAMEIICVDDASTDGSSGILDEYALKFECIRVIHCERNRGQAFARNAGIEKSSGQYIYFLDSDDMLLDMHSMAVLYDEISKADATAVVFDSMAISEIPNYEGNNVRLEDAFDETVYSGADFFNMMTNNSTSIAVWKQFWKRSFLIENNICFKEDTSPHEDLLFTFEAILLAEKIKYTHQKLHVYRIRENSSTTTPLSMKRFRAYGRIYSESFSFLEAHKIGDNAYKSIYSYFSDIQRLVHEYVIELIKTGTDVNLIMEESSAQSVLLGTLMMSEYAYLHRYFSPGEYEKIKNAKNVYIYGAGKVCADVVRMLEKFGVFNCIIVVSDSGVLDFRGRETTSIMDVSFSSDDVMIVGVGKSLVVEVVNNLKQQGINEYINLI